MSVNQLSIFVENRPGAMNEMTKILADQDIDMRALSLAETEGFGIVRIIVNDVVEASSLLRDSGYINKITPVILVEIPDEPGGLNRVLQIFTDAKVNVEYMYAILGGKEINEAFMIFRVDDVKAAEAALRSHRIRLIDQEEVADL